MIVDFFAGSATSAAAVLAQNCKDHVRRRFVLVQLPEPCSEDSEVLREGYADIAEICRERIRRAIARLNKTEQSASPENLGFRSFVLAPSNFKQWRGDSIETPEQLAEQMQMFAKAEKEGAHVDDMLYELLLKFGQELTTPVEVLEVAGGKLFAIDGRQIVYVLEFFSEAMIQPILDLKPREVIAIDGVFKDSDTLKTNLDLQCRDAGVKFTCV